MSVGPWSLGPEGPPVPRVPALVQTRFPGVRDRLESRCEVFTDLDRFEAALPDTLAAWVAVDDSEAEAFACAAECARRHIVTRIGLVAPMTVPLARKALAAGFVDILWWPVSEEELLRATWGLLRPDARALLDRMGRAAGAWDDPVSSALRALSDLEREPCHLVGRLARICGISRQGLCRAWADTLAPWTPKVTLDWVLWLRGVALVEEERRVRRHGLYGLARNLGVHETTLDRTALRRTGLRFLASAVEPGRSSSLTRFEGEWREALAHG